MNLDKYIVETDDTNETFSFISKGPAGAIQKVILYQQLGKNNYNLAFGDWNPMSNDIDDTQRSNNNDRNKVLATVASTIHYFLKTHPKGIVSFQGNTRAKTRIYQIGIIQNLEELTSMYEIEGITKYGISPVVRGVNYEGFIIRNKKL